MGGRFDPQECGSADDSAEQTVLSITDQSALTHTEVGGHQGDGGGAQGRPLMHAASGLSAMEERGPKLGQSSHRRRGRCGGGMASPRAGRAECFFFCDARLFSVRFPLFFPTGGWSPTMTGKAGPGAREMVYIKLTAAAIALRAGYSGLTNARLHTLAVVFAVSSRYLAYHDHATLTRFMCLVCPLFATPSS